MGHHSQILIILGIVGLTVPLLHRLRVSPVLGYLLCGMLVAPKGLVSWLGLPLTLDPDAIQHFADLGVIFLMFMIGLKMSLKDLWVMRRHVIGLGGAQLLVTGAAIFGIAKSFGNSTEISLLIGACFALSSTAVVMQLLEEKKITGGHVGKLCFSILLMQDLAVVPVLAMLADFSSGRQPVHYLMLRSLLMGCVAVAAIYFFGTRLLGPLLTYFSPHNRREWLMSFVLFIVIGAAALTEAAGLSAALGAFLAGLLLAETERKGDIETIIAPVKSLLMGVFFLSVGLMIDPGYVVDNIFWLMASVVGIGCLKAIILFALGLSFGVRRDVAAETAVLLGQGGEFVFVIITLALSLRMIPEQDAHFFLLVTALSMLLTPFVAKLAPYAGRLSLKIFPDHVLKS